MLQTSRVKALKMCMDNLEFGNFGPFLVFHCGHWPHQLQQEPEGTNVRILWILTKIHYILAKLGSYQFHGWEDIIIAINKRRLVKVFYCHLLKRISLYSYNFITSKFYVFMLVRIDRYFWSSLGVWMAGIHE